jgi:hypothetical protein
MRTTPPPLPHARTLPSSRSSVLRAFALVVVVVTAAFALAIAFLPGPLAAHVGLDVRGVALSHEHLLLPAPWTLLLGAVLVLGTIAYGVWQLLPAQRGLLVCDGVSTWMIVANLLMCAWIVAFGFDRMALTVLFMLGALACSAAAFAHTTIDVRADVISPWARAPFAFVFGATLFATVENATTFFVSRGAAIDERYGVLALVALALVAVVIAWVAHDAVVPLTIALCQAGVWDAARNAFPRVGTTALVCFVACTLTAAGVLAWRLGTREDLFRRRAPFLFASWRGVRFRPSAARR